MPHTPHNTASGVMTEPEAAEYLGLKREALRRLRRDGKVAYLRYSDKTVRYELDWLQSFRDAARVAATPARDVTGRARSGRAA